MEKIVYEIGNGKVITFKKPTQSLIIEDYLDTKALKKDINVLEK